MAAVYSSSARSLPYAALVLALALSACARPEGWSHPYGAQDPRTGRVFDVEAGRFIDEDALMARLAEARFVLLGETHDNRDHHRLQARVIRELAARPPGVGAVVFEMLERDQAETIRTALAGPSPDLAAFARAVRWEARGWPPFELYEPVFRAALDAGAQILPGNAPRAWVRRVAREGFAALEPALYRRSALARPLPPGLRQRLEEVLMAAHCARLDRSFLPRLVRVQRLRDAVLADSLLAAAAATSGRVVLITGKGHARRDFGVPWYLLARGARDVVSLGLVAVTGIEERELRKLPFDFLWLTPAAHPPGFDPCSRIPVRERTTQDQRQSGRTLTLGVMPAHPSATSTGRPSSSAS